MSVTGCKHTIFGLDLEQISLLSILLVFTQHVGGTFPFFLHKSTLLFQMSNQGYKRTNFDEDDISNSSSPPGVEFGPSVVFKGGLTFWQKKTALERVLLVLVFALSICVLVMAIVLGSKQEKSVPAPLLTTVPPPQEKCKYGKLDPI